MRSVLQKVSSWGRITNMPHEISPLESPAEISEKCRGGRGLPRGMGRSYGDVCLNPGGALWITSRMNHLLDFDAESGRLVCESGAILGDIQRILLPRGWALPVTPGTQLVTVGGAIANDVHGKNHHMFGSFGDHLRKIKVVRTTGESIICGPESRSDWFSATVGGLGLTGVIAEAEIQLRPLNGPWLDVETIPYEDLSDFFTLADESEAEWEHTVSWVDCISGRDVRGIFMRANPAKDNGSRIPKRKSFRVPFDPPISFVNSFTLRPFNAAYYRLNKRKAGLSLRHYESFLYPLDNVFEWNRIYGPKGFYQYQCVIPQEERFEGIRAILDEIKKAGTGSFLAVLKTFGNRKAPGMLSFPMPGVTLALDFPNTGTKVLRLFDKLDAVVRETGGRLYAAKDARMPRELFELGYSELLNFRKYRDPGINSGLSKRLLDE